MAYRAAFGAGFQRALASRGEMSVAAGFFAVILLAMAGLWRAAVAARPNGSLVGYDFRSMYWYVFAAQCAVAGVRARAMEDIGDEIGSGAVAIAMLRPASVVGMRMAIDAGSAAVRLVSCFLVGVTVCLLTVGAPPSWPALGLAIPAIVIGCAANIAFQHAVGGVAFWLLDAKAGWFLYQKLIFIAGGMLLPLEILPHAAMLVCRALPFATMAYIPGRLASGHIEFALIAEQLLWTLVLGGAAIFVFRAGERRLQSVGG